MPVFTDTTIFLAALDARFRSPLTAGDRCA
jgi:hypothetical protein